MSQSVAAEPITVDSVLKVFRAVLSSLSEENSQGLYSLALSLHTDLAKLYPFLAEMLARGFIAVYLEEEIVGRSKILRDRTIGFLGPKGAFDSLLKARSSQEQLAGLDEKGRIAGRSKAWFEFFCSLKDDSSDCRSIVYLSITKVGKHWIRASAA